MDAVAQAVESQPERRHEKINIEQQPLLTYDEKRHLCDKENSKSMQDISNKKNIGRVLAMAFLWRFVAAVSKICVQALQDRVPAFELNAMRCSLVLCAWTLYFLVKKGLPRIQVENIKAAVLWSVSHVLCSLTAFVSVIFIPIATAETLYIFSNIVLTVMIFVVLLKQDRSWSKVIYIYYYKLNVYLQRMDFHSLNNKLQVQRMH